MLCCWNFESGSKSRNAFWIRKILRGFFQFWSFLSLMWFGNQKKIMHFATNQFSENLIHYCIPSHFFSDWTEWFHTLLTWNCSHFGLLTLGKIHNIETILTRIECSTQVFCFETISNFVDLSLQGIRVAVLELLETNSFYPGQRIIPIHVSTMDCGIRRTRSPPPPPNISILWTLLEAKIKRKWLLDHPLKLIFEGGEIISFCKVRA